MNATQAIAALDRQLAAHGQDITLQRLASGASGTVTKTTVTVRAFVREAREVKDDAAGESIGSFDTDVTISPTQITAAGWTYDASVEAGTVGSIPIHGNEVVINGRTKTVVSVEPILFGATVVRINLKVRGS